MGIREQPALNSSEKIMSNETINPRTQRIPFPNLREATAEQAQSILLDFFHTLIAAKVLVVPEGRDLYEEYARHYSSGEKDIPHVLETLRLIATGSRAPDESDLRILDGAEKTIKSHLMSDSCAELPAEALYTAILKEFSPKVDTTRTGAVQSV
jgi:hypothetical protein